MSKIILELSEKQAEIVRVACESYARAHIGQFHYALEHVKRLPFDISQGLNDYLKSIFFPKLRQNESFSICNKEDVSDDARVAIEISDTIRHFISWKKNPEGGQTVNFHEPMQMSEEKLPTIKEE